MPRKMTNIQRYSLNIYRKDLNGDSENLDPLRDD